MGGAGTVRWLPPQRSLALCLAAIGDHFVATRKVFGTSNVAGARDRPSLRRQLHRHHSVRALTNRNDLVTSGRDG
jgi:hypothetical protein